MDAKDLRNRYSIKSNEELLTILKEPINYTAEAIKIAETILTERGVEFRPAEIPQTAEPIAPPTVFMPLVVGIGLVLLSFYQPIRNSEAAFTVNITLNIFIRFFVVMWLLTLVKNFKLNQTLWIILGVIFGGWSLIAVNIVIWTQPVTLSQPTLDEVLSPAPTENGGNSTHAHDLTACPACNAPLKGEEEKCPGCELSLR